jgi:hypothetical protein
MNNNPIKNIDPGGNSVELPCPWCDREWINYSGVGGIANAALDIATIGFCLLMGCHVDRENDVITGPTQEEAVNSTVVTLANPIGIVTGPGAGALATATEGMGDDVVRSAGSWLDYVPPQYQDNVVGSFSGIPSVETLTDDLVVYRHWGGGAAETGSPWFSPKAYVRPGNARRYLALPDYNSASNISQSMIPKGTTIIYGKASSQVSNLGFGKYAIGGGSQIYLPNPGVVKLIRQVR